MIVRCDSCQSAFAVADEKVEGKKFAFTCPKCAHENIIDNRSVTATVVSSPAVKEPENLLADETFASQPSSMKETPSSSAGIDDVMSEFEDAAIETGDSPDDHSDIFDLPAGADFDDDDDFELPASSEMTSDDDPGLDPDDMDIQMPSSVEDMDDLEDAADGEEEEEEFIAFDDDDSPITGQSDEVVLPDSLPIPSDDDEFELESGAASDGEADFDDDFLDLDDIPVAGTILDANESGDNELDDSLELDSAGKQEFDESLEEDITIDLDSLDIDLDQDDSFVPGKTEEQPETESSSLVEADDDVTLDLDSLDIDLDDSSSEFTPENEADDFIPQIEDITDGVDEEDITLDLDTLDIALDDSHEVKSGLNPDDDDDKLNLTLEDAGLTLEDLDREVEFADDLDSADDDEEELKLTLDEIDPTLNMDELASEIQEVDDLLSSADEFDDHLMTEEVDTLPDIDFDDDLTPSQTGSGSVLDEDDFTVPVTGNRSRFDDDDDLASSVPGKRADSDNDEFSLSKSGSVSRFDDDSLDLPDYTGDDTEFTESYDSKPLVIERLDDDLDASFGSTGSTIAGGTTNLSIDYSMKMSRLGAVVRLFGLYLVGLVPHIIVSILYTVISLILGFLNQVIIIAAGRSVEDFIAIQENTLRYYLTISASLLGIVEEYPVFAGRDKASYPLQFSVTYPLKQSKVIAATRLSIAGILLFVLPHLVISLALTVTMPLVFLIGIVSVLISGRWPHALFEYTFGYYQYLSRFMAFTIGLVDEYPPFRF